MKALIKYEKGPDKLELRDVPVPQIADDEVLIKVEYAGVCGTDIHIHEDRYETMVPVIVGHEFSGSIVSLGSEVSGWQAGDRVVMELNSRACGQCPTCLKGSYNICPEKKAIGFRANGCFTEYVAAPANVLHRIHDSLSYRFAALCEPTAVAVHAVCQRGAISGGEIVAVFGPGPIGLIGAQVAQAMGAAKVVLVGTSRDAFRLQVARKMGIEVVNCQEDPQWRDAVHDADFIVEASGNCQAIDEAFDLVSRAGKLIAVGITEKASVGINWNRALNKETSVSFCYSTRYDDWEMALSLLADGKIAAEKLISAVLPLEEWREAFRITREAKGLKVFMQPQGTKQ